MINGRFLTQQLTGVQRFAFEMTTQLSAKISVTVLVPASATIHPSYSITGLKIVRTGWLKGHFWEQFSLYFYMLGTKNALLLNFCNSAPLLYRNKMSTIHDISVLRHPEWFNKKFVLLYQLLLPLMVKTSEKIITVSNFSATEISSYFKISRDKLWVIYNGFAAREGHTAPLIKKPYSYMLAVSSLEPRKNFSRLMEAFALANLPDIKLLLVGAAGKVFNNKEKLVAVQENVLFTGYVPDDELVDLYKGALCFIYPSLYEGFGLPPLEAMGYGCPVIISRIESLTEVCGEAASYIDPLNIQSMVAAMKSIYANKEGRQEWIEKGLKRAQLFNWNASVEKFLAALNEYRLNEQKHF